MDERLAWFLVIGTIPGAIAGAALEDTIEKKLGQPWLIAVMLAVFAVVLFVVSFALRWTHRHDPQARVAWIVIEAIGVAVLVVGQWFGGVLVYEMAMRVRTTSRAPG